MGRKKNREPAETGGVSRRAFLTTTGLGAVGLATTVTKPAAGATENLPVPVGEMAPVTLSINDRTHRLLVEPRWSLLFVLRDRLGLTGGKEGCHRGECGSCTVLIDGRTRYACLTLALEAEGSEITTVEGLMDGESLGPVQQAFTEKDAFQCGYCTPGQIVAVEGLLRIDPAPDLETIRLGTSGNLCRCGAYPNIFRAAARAAELRRTSGGES